MTKTIIIPDAHVCPHTNMDTADAIGELLAKHQPDSLICLGDLADLDSISSWSGDTHNRNYKQDIDSVVEFQKRLFAPLKRRKHKMPKRTFLIGNHEDRILRFVKDNPSMEDFVSLKDLRLGKYWDNVVEYNGDAPGVYVEDGVMYSHFLPSGVMGRPVGGMHAANSLLNKMHMSCTVGHSHLFDHKVHTKADGTKIHGLSAGCAFTEVHDWAGHQVNKFYDRGIVIKHDVRDGDYDLEWVSLERLLNG